MKTVFLVAGLITWFLYITGLYEKRPVTNDPDLTLLNYLFAAFVLSKLLVVMNQGDELASWLRSIFATYLQWFWFASLLLASVKQKTFFVKHSLTGLLKNLFFYIGSIESVYIFLQLFGLLPAHGEEETFGFLSQPFTNAGLLLACIFITASMIKQDSKLYMYLSLVLQIIGMLILGQVSAILGLLIGLIFFVIKSKMFKLKEISVLLILVLSSVGFASILSPRIHRKIKWFSSVERLTSNRSISCRYEVWKLNFEEFQRHPLLGSKKTIPYFCEIKDKVNKLTHTHNIYLQKLVEGGVIKFAIWFGFYICLGLYLFRLSNTVNPAGFAFYLALSTEGLLENWWGDSEVLAMFFFIAVFAKYLKN